VGRMSPADLAAGRRGADGSPMLEAGRIEGGGREQEAAGALKSRSTAPRPLASWSHDTR
jgi:hypothetical protein